MQTGNNPLVGHLGPREEVGFAIALPPYASHVRHFRDITCLNCQIPILQPYRCPISALFDGYFGILGVLFVLFGYNQLLLSCIVISCWFLIMVRIIRFVWFINGIFSVSCRKC